MKRAVLSFILLAACSSPDPASTPTPTAPTARPAPELGNGSATLTVLLDAKHRLAKPRDLAFNPLRPDELWILNDRDNSVVILHGTTGDMQFERRLDPGAPHFLHKPSSIAFGADETTFGSVGTFATCGESRNENGIEGGEDFMGPALWTSDLAVFAKKNPAGLGSHIDMLHASPLCMGIAHETANVYWAFNGKKNSIVRYDFGRDHNVGLDDHSDGAALQYVTGQVKYAPGVPSHMVYRDGWLYVADTGNGRVVKLDTKSGTRGARLSSMEPLKGGHHAMVDATLVDVVPPGVLTAPSGLEIHKDVLFVGDNATGKIFAFDLEGKKLNELSTGLNGGALAGLAFGPDGKLYFLDMNDSRLFRVDP